LRMATLLRLSARPGGGIRLSSSVRLSVFGAVCAAALGGMVAIFALAAAGPPRQGSPYVATPAVVARTVPNATVVATPLPPPTSMSSDGTLGMAVEFVPAQVRVGAPVLVRLTFQNWTDVPLEWVQIDAQGPWANYTVTEVTPTGSFERVSETAATIRSRIDLAPMRGGAVSLLVIPRVAGDAQFSFVLRTPSSE
jgi:hypothetical protein